MKGRRHRQHVGVEHAPELRQVLEVLGLDANRDAGVGDDDVGAAGGGIEFAAGRDQCSGVGDVDRVAIVAAGQLGEQRIERFMPARNQSERGAAARELARQRRADAAGGAGDEDVFRHGVASLRSVAPDGMTLPRGKRMSSARRATAAGSARYFLPFSARERWTR